MPVPSVVSSPGAPTVAGGVPRVLVVDGIGLSVPNVEGDPMGVGMTTSGLTDKLPGAGIPIVPPRPVVLSAVAPSGMFAPPRDVTTDDVTAYDPGTDDRPADVGEPVGPAPQPVEVIGPAEFPVVAPLSITELEPTLAPEIVGSGHVVLPSVGPTGAGLNPPTKSSVAPNRIPEPPIGDVGTMAPNGDVVPAPGVEGAPICAPLGPIPSSTITAAIANTRFIETSVGPTTSLDSSRYYLCGSRPGPRLTAIDEVDHRIENHLVSRLDAVAYLDLGSEVPNDRYFPDVDDAVVHDGDLQAVAVENNGFRWNQQ
jgi:hypothetical protein